MGGWVGEWGGKGRGGGWVGGGGGDYREEIREVHNMGGSLSFSL